MIKAIIFDYGNVICYFTNDIYREKIAKLVGKTAEEIQKLIQIDSDIVKRFESGYINGQQFYEEFSQICGINVPYDELKKIYSEDKYRNVPGTKELIEKLRKNYKVSLLSNTSEWDWDYMIKAAPEVLTFDSITTSFGAKASKPSPIIFEDALNKLNLKAEECVFIDDILDYVEAAKSLGFEAFQFTTAEQLEEDLRGIGITV